MERIIESQMVFEFEKENIFQIENSALHKDVGVGIKTVEFILHRNDDFLTFIEAKSSSPRPTRENTELFDKFIEEIADKFVHSFNLYYSAVLGRNPSTELSSRFMELSHNHVNYRFVLIIKGHKIEWLLPLQEALHRKIQYHTTIWKSEVILLNEEMALKKRLITSVV